MITARTDKERLDWLERHKIIPMPITSRVIEAVGGYVVNGKTYTCLRDAIDAGMELKP